VALLAALLSAPEITDAVVDRCLPVADRWLPAARDGLADGPIARVARHIAELGIPALSDTGLTKEVVDTIATDLDRVLHTAARPVSNGRTS
jgi:glutamate--cysteine ligase